LPKDRFKREREFRERSARQFDDLYWKIIRRHPTPYELLQRYGSSIEQTSGPPTPPAKAFKCDCGQEIIATSEGQVRRERVHCPGCGKVYKLHPDCATSKDGVVHF